MANVNFDTLAKEIMFGGFSQKTIDKHGLQWRKGCNIDTLDKKVKRALRLGKGRTEWELDFLELYLQDVFKKRSSLNNG